MSGDMAKPRKRIRATVSVSSGCVERFGRSVGTRFQHLRERVDTLEATVEPLVDHVASLEELVRDLDQHCRRPRRRGRRAA